MSDARPTRRAVLAAGVAAVTAFVAGCARTGASGVGASSSASTGASGTGASGTEASGTGAAAAPTSAAAAASPAATPTAAAVTAPAWATAVSAAEAGLVAAYTAVIKAHPARKATLAPLLAAHNAHVKALKSSLGQGTYVAASGTDEAISRLIQAEQKASDLAAKHCLTCPTSAAALLGSIAAADASHLVVLAALTSNGKS